MKDILEKLLHKAVGEPRGEVAAEAREEFGHYTTPIALQLAKERHTNPRVTAEDILRAIEREAPEGFFERLEVAGPGFINMWLSPAAVQAEFARIAENKAYGQNKTGEGLKVIVEFSSPNMAKEMHAGHLRNNSLGEALARLHQVNGYQVIRWNYVGDWGTQFGKIIAAYKMWGDAVELNDHPVRALERMYVRFNEAAKNDPALLDNAREEFRKLETGDSENRELWNKFRTATLLEIEAIYRRFTIRFDEYIGESFFERELEPLIKDLLERGIAEFSEGAVIVKLDDVGLPPALIRKTDGASLYLTRDIVALAYRVLNYGPKRLLYVIGNEQTLQFQQLFAIAGRLGLDHDVELRHVKYGLLLGANGAKMSTREGTSVSIEDLANEAVERVRRIVVQKNPGMAPGQVMRTAEKVGLGSLKYFMLREARTSDIRFDWDKILDLKGDSGPYLLYTYARLHRLLEKGGGPAKGDASHLTTEHELRLMRKMFHFPVEVRRSTEGLITNNLTNYLYELSTLANRFYEDEAILADTHAARRTARLMLAETAAHILSRGLEFLGIETLEAI